MPNGVLKGKGSEESRRCPNVRCRRFHFSILNL